MFITHIFIVKITHTCYNVENELEVETMPEYTEKQKADRQKAVRNYEKNNYRLNIVFPKGTKERIEKLGLDKTNSAFIRDTVLAKLDELEKILK